MAERFPIEFGETEDGYDSDYVDPEYEASLYSHVFHRELLWYLDKKSPDDASTAGKDQDDTKSSKKIVKKKMTVWRPRKKAFVAERSDEEENDEFEYNEDQNVSMSSNIEGLEEIQREKRRFVANKDKIRKRFLKTPQSEWTAKFSVFEIQHFLGGTPDDWQVCVEDSSKMFGFGRYYQKKGTPIQCKRCREYGHRVAQCTVRIKRCCIICGEEHIEWKCPDRNFCIICMNPNHPSDVCYKRRIEPWRDSCRRCHFRGHRAHACPDLWRQFHSTTSLNGRFQLKRHGLLNQKKEPRVVYCYNCGRSGHLGHECRKSTMEGRLICFNPAVTIYDSVYESNWEPSPSKLPTEHFEPKKTRRERKWEKNTLKKKLRLFEDVKSAMGEKNAVIRPHVSFFRPEKFLGAGRANFDKLQQKKRRKEAEEPKESTTADDYPNESHRKRRKTDNHDQNTVSIGLGIKSHRRAATEIQENCQESIHVSIENGDGPKEAEKSSSKIRFEASSVTSSTTFAWDSRNGHAEKTSRQNGWF